MKTAYPVEILINRSPLEAAVVSPYALNLG